MQTQAAYALDKISTMPALDEEQHEVALNSYPGCVQTITMHAKEQENEGAVSKRHQLD